MTKCLTSVNRLALIRDNRNLNWKRNGHTFVELMIVSTMLIMAGILIIALFGYGMDAFRTTNQRIQNQQNVLIALSRLNREIEKTAFASLSFCYPSGNPANGDLAISFMTPDNASGEYQADGYERPVYQAYLIFFCNRSGTPPENTLRKIRVPLSPATTTATPMDTSTITNHVRHTQSEIIFSGVESFKALDYQTGAILVGPENPFKLEITMEEGSNPHISPLLEQSRILTRIYKIPR